jgi:aspartate carbamoyltransferase catalytic subunit
MKIYGLFGVTHGAAHVLTVMSPDGARAALDHMTRTEDLIINAGDGRLTQYLEQRDGALQRLIDTYDVEVLSKAQWDRRKQALAGDIWK